MYRFTFLLLPPPASPLTASSSSCAATGVDDLLSGSQWRGVGPIKEGAPLQPHQKATINFLVGEYLSAQGYKMAAITLAEEDGNQVILGGKV